MAFALRGVAEAAGGRSWSWAERDRMIDFLAEHGFNLFIYASGADPLLRERWREPYLPEEVERFARLAERCAAREVGLVFGIAPPDCRCDAAADLDQLWGKLAPLHAAGVRGFLLRCAGPPGPARERGTADAGLANALLARLSAADTWPPSRRSGARASSRLFLFPAQAGGDGSSPYLAALGAELDPAIAVFWTGREPLAPTLSAADAGAVSVTLRRPVLFWDNYPGGDPDAHLHPRLRPVRGREAALDGVAGGIVAAGGPLPEASKIALHTYAAWAADPAGYTPELCWERALLAVTGDPEDASAVGVLGLLARHSWLEPPLDNYLVPKLAQFWQRWGGAPEAAGPDLPGVAGPEPGVPGRGTPLERQAAIAGLAREFTRLHWKVDKLLGRMHNPYLHSELAPWAKKLQVWVEVGELGLEVLRLALVDPREARLGALREKTLARLGAARENPCWVAGDLLEQFCRRCLWAEATVAAGPT